MAKDPTSLWNLSPNPTLFFHEKIIDAQAQQNIKLTENVEFYLVNLLCEAIRVQDDSAQENGCLALILKKALESPHNEKVSLYKRLADTALYFSGFYQEYFNNKSFDIKYYINMGGSAYAELANLMRGKATFNATMSQIYKEMSDSFVISMDILLHVSEKTFTASPPRHLLSIYDAWLQTSSAKLEKDLYALGITPVPTPIRKVQ